MVLLNWAFCAPFQTLDLVGDVLTAVALIIIPHKAMGWSNESAGAGGLPLWDADVKQNFGGQ